MTTITNRRELANAVNEAYDMYLDTLDDLAEEYKIVPGSPRQVTQDDPRTHLYAEVRGRTFGRKPAVVEFNTEQGRLNDEFSEYVQAQHKAKGA